MRLLPSTYQACHLCARTHREPVKIVGGNGPDPLAREIGAAKVKDMRRDGVRRTLVPPEKELPLARTRLSEESSTTALRVGGDNSQSREDSMGLAIEDDCQQPWVVLVAEDQLVPVEAKREALRRKRYDVMAACCKVRSPRSAVPQHTLSIVYPLFKASTPSVARLEWSRRRGGVIQVTAPGDGERVCVPQRKQPESWEKAMVRFRVLHLCLAQRSYFLGSRNVVVLLHGGRCAFDRNT